MDFKRYYMIHLLISLESRICKWVDVIKQNLDILNTLFVNNIS